MKIILPDGIQVDTLEVLSQIKKLRETVSTTDLCFAWPLVQGLIDKLEDLDPNKTYTFFFRDGTTAVASGTSASEVLHTALPKSDPPDRWYVVDFWKRGSCQDHYKWNATKLNWEPTSLCTGV